MEKKRYKAILNIGYKNERIVYFDKLTQKRLQELRREYNYILLYYNKNTKCYLCCDRSLTLNEYQVALFYELAKEYEERG